MNTDEKEVWKDITIYGGIFINKYQVSNLGRVRSLERNYYTHNKKGTELKVVIKERILRWGIDKMGYAHVRLHARVNGKLVVKCCYVHRLVLQSFNVPNPHCYRCCHHIDEHKLNNKLSNLCYVSHKMNSNAGSCQKRKAEAKKRPIAQYTLDGTLVRTFDSIKQVNDELGYNSSQIIKVAKHKKGCHTSRGYKWEYISKKNEKKITNNF